MIKNTFPLILGILLALTFSPGATATDCLARYLDGYKSSAVVRGQLPRTQAEFKSIFETAQTAYLTKVDFVKLENMFKEIAKNGYKGLSDKQLRTLKKDRVYSMQVRGTYTVFSDTHKPPKDFHKFVRDFGYLNDAIAEGQNKTAKKLAERLLTRMQAGHHNPQTFGFTPAPAGSITNFAHAKFTEIENLMSRPINIHQYHDIRKDIRNYRFLFSTLKERHPNQGYGSFEDRVESITKQMGETKDELFMDKNMSHTALVTIEPKIQAEIREFFNEFRRANPK